MTLSYIEDQSEISSERKRHFICLCNPDLVGHSSDGTFLHGTVRHSSDGTFQRGTVDVETLNDNCKQRVQWCVYSAGLLGPNWGAASLSTVCYSPHSQTGTTWAQLGEC